MQNDIEAIWFPYQYHGPIGFYKKKKVIHFVQKKEKDYDVSFSSLFFLLCIICFHMIWYFLDTSSHIEWSFTLNWHFLNFHFL
jgi:hypothetical protein